MPPITLSELRGRLGASQAQVADHMGTTQPAVLKAERSTDPQISTIRRYVDALGRLTNRRAAVMVSVHLGDEEFDLVEPFPADAELHVESALPSWRLRAWDDPDLEERWLSEGVIAISEDEIGDLSTWPGNDEVRLRLKAAFQARDDERSSQAYGTFVRYWRYFRLEMKPGQLVAVPLSGRRVGVAEILGDYEYRNAEAEPRMRHVRPVRWIRRTSRDALDETIRKVVNAPGTVCQIKHGDLRDMVDSADPGGTDEA